VKDGRSEPGHPKKRPQRAAGGPPRRASDDPAKPKRPAGSRSKSDRERTARADREESQRPESSRPARRDRDGGRREEIEPGFGPFGGGRGFAAPGGRRQDRKRGDEEARTVRSAAEEAVARARGERPSLRIVRGDGEAPQKKREQNGKGKGARRAAPTGVPTTPRPKQVRDGGRLQEAMIKGARALDRGYEQEALRMLRPFREPHPDSADLRELLGLTYYRLGRWSLAQKEMEAYVALTDSTDQHPVLMDCARALGKHKRVETLWEELRAVSPSAEVVTEGRIVAAGTLADRGRLDEAIKVLERAPASPKRIQPHHLRLWYALADLQERAGDIPAARALFRRISAQDPAFVDVAERLAALS
jgi:thioredoxin-like negative regulator of GroEL